MHYGVSLEGYGAIYVGSFLFAKDQQAFIESINHSGSPKKNIWYGTQKLPKT